MSENRASQRFIKHEQVFIEVMSHDGAAVIKTQTLDVSATGMRLLCEKQVEPGMIHQICIQVTGIEKRFLLIAEIKWSKPEQGGWLAGLEIQDAEGFDLEPWRELWGTHD